VPDSSSDCGEVTAPEWTIRFIGYYPVDERVDERLRRVCEEIANVPASALQVDEDARVITVDYSQIRSWFDASRERIHASRVNRVVVKPPWDDCETSGEDVVVEIDPGGVFGSGLHETTQLSLEAIQKHLQPGESVVDFGTGSGVLAIAAAKLGASKVIAFDIAPEAVEAATKNVRANGVDSILEVYDAANAPCPDSAFDLVIANVTEPTLIANACGFSRMLKSGGRLICAGFGTKQVATIQDSFEAAGFTIHDKLFLGDWVSLVATKAQATD